MAAEIAEIAPRTRLPVPRGMDPQTWLVLTDMVYPSASATGIALALAYCKARKLDPLKKPVHVVARWNAKLGKMVETLQPGISELEVTASRTGEYAGLDGPVFGPDVTHTFKGRVRDGQGWKDSSVTVTYPEYCDRTVYRVVKGVKQAFTERVYWREEVQTLGRGNELPTEMWARRPKDQFAKVAKAAALRAAFPEEQAGPTVDEIGERDILDDTEQPPPEAAPVKPATMATEIVDEEADIEFSEVQSEDPHELTPREEEDWEAWSRRFIGVVRAVTDHKIATAWVTQNEKIITDLKKAKPKMHTSLMRSVNEHMLSLAPTT